MGKTCAFEVKDRQDGQDVGAKFQSRQPNSRKKVKKVATFDEKHTRNDKKVITFDEK